MRKSWNRVRKLLNTVVQVFLLCSIHRSWSADGIEISGLVENLMFGPEDSPIRVIGETAFNKVAFGPGSHVIVVEGVTITVLTTMQAIGAPGEPVVFEAAPGAEQGWEGFLFENTPPGSEFDWCVIKGANNGALRLIHSFPVIRNTVFETNSAAYGGAIYAKFTTGVITATNCTFRGNTSSKDGGAIWVNTGEGRLDIVDCDFEGNIANPEFANRHTYGGAIRAIGNMDLLQSTFVDNRARAHTIYIAGGRYVRGGAVAADGGDYRIVACEFFESAIHFTADSRTPDASRGFGATVHFNSGSMLLENTLIADSWISAPRNPDRRGSAVYVASGDLHVQNCTIVHNSGAPAIQNASGSISVNSSIIYFNHDSVNQIAGTAEVNYSDVQGGWLTGEGNLNFNPALDARYRVLSGSPVVDVGNPDPAMNDVFPPGRGTNRNDMGIEGGLSAVLWLDGEPPPGNMFSLDTARVIIWDARTDVVLLHAVTPDGPWVPYLGEILTAGNQNVVVVSDTEPRIFFKLLQLPDSNDE